MWQRSRTDIIADILDAANETSGVGKTKMMYKAFLSYAQLKEYLPVLTENRLLDFDEDAQTFKTTKEVLSSSTPTIALGKQWGYDLYSNNNNNNSCNNSGLSDNRPLRGKTWYQVSKFEIGLLKRADNNIVLYFTRTARWLRILSF